MPLYKSPISLTGPSGAPALVVSLFADQGVTATHQGYQIGTWADQSGKGNDFTGAGSGIDQPFPLSNALAAETKTAMYFPDWASTAATSASEIALPNGLSILICYKLNNSDTTVAQTINCPNTFVGLEDAQVFSFGLNAGNLVYKHYSGGVVSTIATTGLSLASGNVNTVAVTHHIDGTVKLFAGGVESIADAIDYNSSTRFDSIGRGYLATDYVKDWNVGEIHVYNGVVDNSVISAFHTSAFAYWGPW